MGTFYFYSIYSFGITKHEKEVNIKGEIQTKQKSLYKFCTYNMIVYTERKYCVRE